MPRALVITGVLKGKNLPQYHVRTTGHFLRVVETKRLQALSGVVEHKWDLSGHKKFNDDRGLISCIALK